MGISNGTLLKVAAVAMIVSISILIIVGLSQVPRVLREGRMPTFRGCADPVVRRASDPVGFWFVFSVYGLGMLVILALAVWVGLEVFVFKKLG